MTNEALRKKIGGNIAKIRKERGFTQSELAKRTGKDRQNIYRLEIGNHNASIELLYQISKALSVPLKDIFDFE